MEKNYTSKTNQLKKLVKKFQQSLTNDKTSFSQLKNIITQIKSLINELKETLTQLELKKILGVSSLLIGLSFSSQTIAQSFDEPVSNPFGIEFPKGEDLVYPRLVDIDNDGDLDLFVGAYSGSGIYYQENTGTATSPSFATAIKNPFNIVSEDSEISLKGDVFFVDIDDDGDLDLFNSSHVYYNATGGNQYGADSYSFSFQENIGTATVPNFKAPVHNPFSLKDDDEKMYYSSSVFIDIDGDGDYDILALDSYESPSGSQQSGELHFFENTGTAKEPTFSWKESNPFGFIPSTVHGGLSYGDLDNDGDLDLFVAEMYGGTYYYENTGTATSPSFSKSVTDKPFGLSFGEEWSYLQPTLADLDNDGDLDLLMSEEYEVLYYYENTEIVSVGLIEKNQVNADVYPNPVQNELNIDAEETIEKVQVFDLLGQTVLSVSGQVNTISVQQLPTGIYTVKITFSEGNYSLKKIQKD